MQREVIVRVCSACELLLPMDRKGMQSGILFGDEYYCHRFCLSQALKVSVDKAQAIVDDAVAEDSDSIYYTEWELEEI
jgi:hypothetical protein